MGYRYYFYKVNKEDEIITKTNELEKALKGSKEVKDDDRTNYK